MNFQHHFFSKILIQVLSGFVGLTFLISLKADQQRVIELLKGSQVTVSMGENEKVDFKIAANPSTGYRWELVSPILISCLTLKESSFEPTAKVVGGSGYQHWQVENSCKSGNKQLIRFEYRRAWEKGVPSIYWSEVLIDIKP